MARFIRATQRDISAVRANELRDDSAWLP